MILLSDEEMKALRPDVPMCQQTVFDCEGCSGQCRVIARGQLKQAYDYLWEEAFVMTDGSGDVLIPRETWETLREETE